MAQVLGPLLPVHVVDPEGAPGSWLCSAQVRPSRLDGSKPANGTSLLSCVSLIDSVTLVFKYMYFLS